MASHPPSGGGAPANAAATDKAKKWLIRGAMLFAAIGIVFLLIHFIFPLFAGDTDEKDTRQQRASTASQIVVATPKVAGRTITAGITCPPWSFEKQQCTFDSIPTAGFGQKDTGLGFCLDIHYGQNQSYRFQRWDAGTKGFVDITDADGPEVRVSETRFVGNRGSESVTVTYWLEGREGCGASQQASSSSDPAPQPLPVPVQTGQEQAGAIAVDEVATAN